MSPVDAPVDESAAPVEETTPPAEPVEEEPAPTDYSQGYKICTAVLPDGTFNVYIEPLAPEGPTGSGEEGLAGQPSGHQVDSFEQALKVQMMLYKENPIENSDQANLQAGFEGERPGQA